MLYGFSKRTRVQASIGECPCDSDRPHGIQAVSVLDDLSLYCIRSSALVSAERNRIDDPADCFNLIFRHGMLYQKRPGVSIVFRHEELVIVRVMEEGSKRRPLHITGRGLLCYAHGSPPYADSVLRIVASCILAKKLLYIL